MGVLDARSPQLSIATGVASHLLIRPSASLLLASSHYVRLLRTTFQPLNQGLKGLVATHTATDSKHVFLVEAQQSSPDLRIRWTLLPHVLLCESALSPGLSLSPGSFSAHRHRTPLIKHRIHIDFQLEFISWYVCGITRYTKLTQLMVYVFRYHPSIIFNKEAFQDGHTLQGMLFKLWLCSVCPSGKEWPPDLCTRLLTTPPSPHLY